MKRKTKIFALIGSSAACVALFLTSTIVGMEEDKNENKPFVAYGLDIEDEDSQYLGYGYDVTAGKAISDPDALNLAYPILDVNNPELVKYEKAFSSSQTTYQSFSSKSANEIASEYGLTLGGGISAKIAKVDVSIETKFNTNTTFNKKVEEEYSYYTIYAKNRTVLFQAGTDVFSQYLHPDFLKSVSKMSSAQDAELVYQKYGTHLVTGYNLGGIFEMTNYFATCSTSYVRQNTTSFSSQVSAAFGAYGAGVGFSFSQNYGSLDNNSFAVNNYKCTTYGGYTFPGLTIDQAFSFYQTAFGAGYIYGLWTDSINAGKNLSIVSIPQSSAMIPLYNLLPDGHEYDDARSYLVEAYIKRCGISYSKFMASHPDVNPNVKPTTISPNDIGYSGYGYEEFHITGDNTYSSTYVSSDDYKGTISTTPGNIISFDFDRSLYEGRTLVWEFAPSSGLDSRASVIDARNGVIKIKDTAPESDLVLRLKFDGTQIYSVNIHVSAASTYGGGAGTTSNPYLISTAEHLYTLMDRYQDWGASFKLTADINLDNSGSGVNTSIKQIGRVYNGVLRPFTGKFDGNFHSIRHYRLYLNNLPSQYTSTDGTLAANDMYNAMGLFGVNTGQITNLTVDMGTLDQNTSYDNNRNVVSNYKYAFHGLDSNTNANLDAIANSVFTSGNTNSYFSKAISIIGGIVGKNSGKIINCHVKNLDLRFVDYSVSGKGTLHPMQVGLICGYNSENGVVSECSAKESTIRGYTYATDKTSNVSFRVGGIIGENAATSNVAKCSIDKIGIDTFVNSTVKADDGVTLITKEYAVGGIIGYSYASLEDCVVSNIDDSTSNDSESDSVPFSIKTETNGKSGASGSVCNTALFLGNTNTRGSLTRCVAYGVNTVINRIKTSDSEYSVKNVCFGASNYSAGWVSYTDCVLEQSGIVTFVDKNKAGLTTLSNAKYSNLPEAFTSSDYWESNDVTEYPQIVYEKLNVNSISFDFSKVKKYFAYDGTKVESFQAGEISITAFSSSGDEVAINDYRIDYSEFSAKVNNANVELGTVDIYVTALDVTASYQVHIVEIDFVGVEAIFNNVVNPDYYAGDLLNPNEITVKMVMADGTRKNSIRYKESLNPASDSELLNKRMYFEIEDVDKPLVAGVNNFNVSFYDINSGKTYTTIYSVYAKRSNVASVNAVENTDNNILPLAVGKKEVTPDDLAGLEVEVTLASVSDEIDARIINTATPRRFKLVFDEEALSRGKIIVRSLNGASYLTKEIDSSEVEVISSPIVFGQNRVQICYGGYLDTNKTEINVLGTYQDLTSYFDEYKALIDTYFDGNNYSETSASMAPLRTRFEIIKDALALKEKLSSLSGDTEYVNYTQKLDILIADYNADIGAVNLVIENIVKSPTSFYYNALSNSGYLVLPLLIALLFLII